MLLDNGDSIGRALPAQLLSQDGQKSAGWLLLYSLYLSARGLGGLLLWDLTGSCAKPVQSQFKMTINQNGCVYSFCTGISVRLCVLPWLREDVLLSLKLFP